jgi:hypothetical protein
MQEWQLLFPPELGSGSAELTDVEDLDEFNTIWYGIDMLVSTLTLYSNH